MTNSKAHTQAKGFEGNKGTFFRSIAEKAQAFTVDVNYNTNFSFTVPEGEYLLLGDDRLVSSDSRHVGTFKAKDITGEAKFRFLANHPYRNILRDLRGRESKSQPLLLSCEVIIHYPV